MRRLLYVLGLVALCIGCSSGGGTGTVSGRPTPTPTPTTYSYLTVETLCRNAPTLTLPGTYPLLVAGGVLTGTNFALDTGGLVYSYAPVPAASVPSPTPSATPTPDPSASPYDIWIGTVTYSGTPHDSTICFLASALTSRGSYDFSNPADNSQVFSVPQFGINPTNYEYINGNADTVENFVLTLSTTSTSSGSFTLAGGGGGTIDITQHLVETNSELRRQVNEAIAAHKLPGPLR